MSGGRVDDRSGHRTHDGSHSPAHRGICVALAAGPQQDLRRQRAQGVQAENLRRRRAPNEASRPSARACDGRTTVTGRAMLQRRVLLKIGGAAAVASALGSAPAPAQSLEKLKSIYPTRSASSWPMWIAKEAGYYQSYGLEVTPEFGVHPIGIAGLISGEVQFSNYSLD